ncbi:hypothetical protein O159_22720 [Leifsonia xyli subsp. cynodontis DSM 46306]|uniref:DUF7882 domain-containing protein n=1 Tax=Leifsonia xyli subsp. cynodontis DSM 46306 TaxID=1389489 RepID=U3P8T0_LEIXC|nr:hypothetical protein [Leifsonia xyli]AGW42236.1 hypothetical protein O159_22720 [Leifsonia xyli subsp. cynodontis DSM 46306]
MGVIRYPGVPDITYSDEIIATIQQIIVTQQKMGQGFWLERRGSDDNVVGHDAIWIDPSMSISVEFDTLDHVDANNALFEEWKMLLLVEGADRLVIHPDEDTVSLLKRWIDEGDSALE